MKYSKVTKSNLPTAMLIADSSYLEAYDIDTPEEFIDLCKQLVAIAKDEYNFEIERRGMVGGIIEWLQSLPTVFTVPFYTHEVYEWLYANTKLDPDDTDAKHLKEMDNYWRTIATILVRYADK